MLAEYFPPDTNGASTRVYNAARGLLLQGCKVAVITSFPHYPDGHIPPKYRWKIMAREKIDGIDVIRTWIPSLSHSSNFQRSILHMSFMFLSLLGLVHIRKVDIIFAMNPNLFAFYPSLLYKILFRKNIIRNVDDLWPEVFYDLGIVKSRLIKALLDFAAKISYDIPLAIIPISSGYVRTLVAKYHIPREKIAVIEHGVDTAQYHRLDNPTKTNRNMKTIMYSGALNIGYDFDIVLKAAKLLSSEPVHFVIRGKGDLSGRLKNMIKEENITNVSIRTDSLSKPDLITFLNSADVFLLPMSPMGVIDQGLPTKLLEYQALGKPIVCISRGEAGRYISLTQSGLVADERRPEEMARLIMLLVRDDSLAVKLGTNGIKNIENNLTLEKIGERLMDIVKRVL